MGNFRWELYPIEFSVELGIPDVWDDVQLSVADTRDDIELGLVNVWDDIELGITDARDDTDGKLELGVTGTVENAAA